MKAQADANIADLTTRERSLQDELDALKARIEQADFILPEPHERHCLDCFQKGRNAAVRMIRHGAA